jgi:hypothetical protein
MFLQGVALLLIGMLNSYPSLSFFDKFFETERELMSGNVLSGKGLSRRTVTILWVTALAGLIVFLLYKEWIALLYVLATLGVSALLVIVGMADLSGAKSLTSGRVGETTESASNER